MSAPRSSRFGLGPWEIDLSIGTAVSPDDVVCLTATETRLLARLRAAEGAPVGREVLLREVWEYASTVRSRTADTTLRRLRDKLEPERGEPRLLVTHRGQGIALNDVREARPLPSPTRLVRRSEAPRLVGRQRDVDRLCAAIDGAAWITLVGPAGVGKTALASVAADRWDGAGRATMVISIAGRATAAAVEAEVRRAIDGGRSDVGLVELVGGLHEALLVLDDADALPATEAAQLTALSRVARILVTRQAPFALPDERRVRVAPLDPTSAGELATGLAQRRDADLSPEDVSAIVEASGGLPLAIELAVPVATVAGTGALRGSDWHGVGDGASRTLRGALDRSIHTLDDDARDLLTDLTAFAVGFDASAAEALRPGALGPLMRLHERGLVEGREEMRLLSPVRLHVGPAPATAIAARDAWLAGVGTRDHVVLSFGQRHRVDLLDALDHAATPGPLAWTLMNVGRDCGMGLDIVEGVRAALDRCPGDAMTMASLVGALYFRGERGDELRSLAMATPGAPGIWARGLVTRDPDELARLVSEGDARLPCMDAPLGVTGVMRADLLARVPDARRALSGLRALRAGASDAPELRVRLVALMVMMELRLGRIAAARRRLDEVTLVGDAHVAILHGIVAVLDGDPQAAIAPFERARDRFAALGDRRGLGSALAYRDLAAWSSKREISGVIGPPLTSGPESLRRFVADPHGPWEALPEPDARRLVAAWQQGHELPNDLRGWPVRVLRAVLERAPART